jgi:hypothetical protein
MVRDWFPIPGQTHRRQLRNKALSECDYRAERLSNRAHPQLGKTLEYLTCERSAPYAVRPRSNISEPSNPHKFPIANFVILITKRLLSSGESLLKPAALLLLTDERAGNCATVQSGLNPYFGPLFDWNSFFPTIRCRGARSRWNPAHLPLRSPFGRAHDDRGMHGALARRFFDIADLPLAIIGPRKV